MRRHRILLVDDERTVLQGLEKVLLAEGYEVATATDGEAGLAIAAVKNPDLVILDILMPGLNGFEVCQRLRMRNADVRILIVTALHKEMEKVRGLELGADDYVTKPVSLSELKARIKALLRRTGSFSLREDYRFGEVTIDPVGREVTKAGELIDLTAKEFDLLCYLVQHEGEALSRDRLLEEVWGHDQYPITRTVDIHILHLRRKLERDPSQPRYFLTLHGVGYKFVACD